MSKKLLLLGICILASISSQAQLYKYSIPYDREFWNQNVREDFFTYRSLDKAWKDGKDSLENATILSGNWKMTVTSDTASAIRATDFSSWETVTVPFVKSQMRDPLFTPKKLPVMGEAIEMPKTKEFTVLKTDAIVKFDYTDKAMFLHIGAVSGKTSVYVNGKKLATLRESYIPHDITITKNVVRGRNSVVLVIEPYNEESVVERWANQLSACIPRDVYLYAQPKIRMYDFVHKTRLDPTYKNGILEAGIVLKTELINTHNITVYYDLYDMNGRIVNSDTKPIEIGWYAYDTIRFISSIQNVNLWSAKNPYLYTIVYRIKRDGRTLENITRKVGFRQIDIKDDTLLINGKVEKIYGVNADLYPELVISYNSKEKFEAILKGLKSQGFNAIRTPYPLQKEFYDAADMYGFYVSETAPINSHGLSRSIHKGGTLANNPAWDSVYISRVVSTYEKGKSHTCIIMWEMGEDAGNGYCFCNAYNAIKRLDQYRPISYSGAGYQWTSDICMDGHMKPNGRKPYIPSRMKYDKEFWSNHQGGFINEKIEGRVAESDYTESIVVVENVRPVDEVQDVDGIWETSNKAGNRTLKSDGPISVELTGNNTVIIHNGLDHNLNKYSIIHGIQKNGTIEPLEVFSVDINPGESKSVTLIKTGKKKKAYLVIENIATIEL